MSRINVSVHVEVLPGATIQELADDLCRLASLWGTAVQATFNASTLIVRPNQTPAQVVETYRRQPDDFAPPPSAR